VAYYPFNGNANDASGFANNPVLDSGSPTNDQFNTPQSAYRFNGTQQVHYATQSQIESTSNLTVSCWLRTTNTFAGQFHGLVCKGTPTNPWLGYQVGVSGDHVQVETDLAIFSGVRPINDGLWHLVVAVFNKQSGILEIYVDGTIDATHSTPSSNLSTPFQLHVGVEREGVNFFIGSIDEVRIYNRALSSNEVAQLHQIESSLISEPYLNVRLALKVTPQGPGVTNGGIATIAPSKPLSLTTAGLLSILAFDANVMGSWPSNQFPKGSTLAIAGDSVLVLHGTNILLNVSELLRFTTGEQEVFSGSWNTTNGLATPKVKKLQLAGMVFDDSSVAGGANLMFHVNGLLSQSTTDSPPIGGVYKEKVTLKLTAATGDGTAGGAPIICSGTVTATGIASLTTSP
jgi:hypothetical protein